LPVSVVETPDLKVVGARLYKHNSLVSGKKAISEFLVFDSYIQKVIKGKKSKQKKELDEFLKLKDSADDLVLIAYLNTKLTTIGQKKPVIVEVPLSGKYDNKINYLKDHFGKTISFKDTFEVNNYLDIKSVTKGHGFTGPVKRFGIKIQRPKHKKQRVVGSIGPWHPATVMYTVPRAGQHGFHNRVTYNKKLLVIDNDVSKINPKSGFTNYGVVKNNYALVAGSIPGPSKRVVVFRNATRPIRSNTDVTDVQIIKQI
jgi:large subunit ribosomal protein L3